MQHDKESREKAGASGDGIRKVLTFSLGGEVYGVDILRVKEIRGWSPVTRIPQTPASILGVLNLRGLIVPIVDLRVRFALKTAEFTPLTVIIVLSLRNESGQRECGIVVDNVNDVVDIATDSIKPAPELGGGQTGEYIEGITSHEEQMLILLNAESVASPDLSATVLAEQAA
ncbi:MAG TPA: chemotaxis protein CheW [Steroidobacteraceae bacterium]|nr:chemotaxis protein CheW [Steroidobacteraceae bacterium]